MRKLTTLLLLAVSGTTVASTEIQAPCPDTASHTDVLHVVILAEDADVLEEAAVEEVAEEVAESVKSPVSETKNPEFSTRLPGVSANDMPDFRRHMFRTDI